MSEPLRVGIVTRSLMMGGAQNHIVKLCKELEKKNISISIFLLINDEPRDLIQEIPDRFQVYISPYRRHDLRTIFWLAKGIKEKKIHLVHSFLWHADFYASLLKFFVPNLVVLASERGDRGLKSFYKWTYRLVDKMLVFNLADCFCANSKFGANLLNVIGCKSEKIKVIHNGIDLAFVDSKHEEPFKEFYKWPQSTIILGVVSRLITYKGIDSFIRIIKLCKEDIRVIIIGNGPEKENLQRLIKKLKLEKRVILAGQYIPAISAIKAFDICVLPTREDSEHCSNSILEYMACAKPVIATNVGGNKELVIPGETGFLVDPKRLDEMAEILDMLFSDKVLVRKMGVAGRKRIEDEFQIENISQKIFSLWHEFYQ